MNFAIGFRCPAGEGEQNWTLPALMAHKRLPDQLTLFQCVEQVKKHCLDGTRTLESRSSGRSTPVSGDCSARDEAIEVGSTGTTTSSERQSNYISIQRPSGPTTVIVNSVPQLPLSTVAQVNYTHSSTSTDTQEIHEAPDDIATTADIPPVRPSNVTLPETFFSGKPRAFNPGWYDSYPWLEYSLSRNAVILVACLVSSHQWG